MTLTEWVFLIWNTDTIYNGHPAGDDVRRILDAIGAPYGFTAESAFDYAAPQRERLEEFSLRERDEPRDHFCMLR
jgi:hypothetical protein